MVILESPQKSGKKNNFSSTFHHPSQKGGTAAIESPFFYTDGPYQSMDNTFNKMDLDGQPALANQVRELLGRWGSL